MRLKTLMLGAVAAVALAPAAFAERASDGDVKIIYWQAPSILNPFLSGGTKDVESSSIRWHATMKTANWCPGWSTRSPPWPMAASPRT